MMDSACGESEKKGLKCKAFTCYLTEHEGRHRDARKSELANTSSTCSSAHMTLVKNSLKQLLILHRILMTAT